MLQIADRRSCLTLGALEDRPVQEETSKALAAERDALRERELAFKPERETLERLISIYVDFVEGLNGHVGIVNAMARKLSVDNEHRVALLKAVQAQLGGIASATRGSVAALIGAFEANVLAGHDLAQRKAVADGAFARQLQAGQSTESAKDEATDSSDEALPES